MHRRLLASALVLTLLFAFAPAALAADEPPPEDPPPTETPPPEDPPAEEPPPEEPPADEPPPDEAPAYTPEITFDPTKVKENSRIGTIVGPLGLSGADPEATYSFALVDGKGARHNSLFRIADGNVATAASLDYEALGSKLRIRIAAIDVATEESVATQTFVVTLKRVDDITLDPSTVAENAPAGTVVGTLSVPNAGGNLTYSTTTGDGHRHNYLFDVVGDKLVTTRLLDFEELGSSLTVRIAATDGGGTVQYENPVTVTLTDVPDVVVNPNRIDENVEVGTVVGDISVIGDDDTADYKFRFAHGAGDSHNDAFAIVRGQLVTATEMDFETMGATLSVRIRAVDRATGEELYANPINIGLNDVDDEDPDNGAAEQEIIDALRPMCEPYGDDFVLLRFPQLDPGSSYSYTFGADRDGGERRHRGADIYGEKHSPVVAVAEGTVVRYGTGQRAGHYVVVEHEGGWESIYIHLNNDNFGTDDGAVPLTDALAPGIVPGAEVEAGQVLGWVGDSGNAEGTSPHTHFELWEGDHLADPYACLDQAWKWQRRVSELGDTIQ